MTELPLPVSYDALTPARRRQVREQYAVLQGGACRFCRAPLAGDPPAEVRALQIDWSLFPPHFLTHPIHLQHDHRTGLTEGAVHAYCNAVLWQHHGR